MLRLPSFNLQLSPFGNLSVPRAYVTAATAGNKILICRGSFKSYKLRTEQISSRVDIYDMVSQNWSTAELSQGRHTMAVAVAGNKIFFAGGIILFNPNDYGTTNTIDIYDVISNSWSVSS